MGEKLKVLSLLLLLCQVTTAQSFRYSLGIGTGNILGESGKTELNDFADKKYSYQGSSAFTTEYKTGFDFEVMSPITQNFELGFQLGYWKYSGTTQKAPIYNFFMSQLNPLPKNHKYPDEPLVFNTKMITPMITAKWYFFPYTNNINIYFKLFGGVAFTGTEFTFQNPVYSVRYDVGVLFARGTLDSDYPKQLGAMGGLGIGFSYRISKKFDLCLGTGAAFVNSDIVNGVPNFKRKAEEQKKNDKLLRTSCITSIARCNLSLIFSPGNDGRYNKIKATRSRKVRRRPTWKRRSRHAFSRKRRR